MSALPSASALPAPATATAPVLAALGLSALLPSLALSSANVALPTLSAAFGASFQAVQWVVVAYVLANTLLIVGAGRLGDRLGRRRVLLAGLALYAAASLACAAAPSLALLIAARALQGLAASVLMALAMALVAEAVPKARAGTAMGLLGTVSAVGTALGPSLGGLLLAAAGWRAVFLVQAPLALVALWGVRRTLAAGAPPAAGAHAAATPLREVLLHDATRRASLAAAALVAAVLMTTLVVGPFHLAHALGLGAAGVGLAMSVGPAVAAFAGVPAGRLVDRIGGARAAAAGVAAVAAGAATLAATPLAFGVAGYVVPLVVVTAGYALFQAANNSAVMGGVPAGARGTVSGALQLARNLGLLAGASAMGAVFAWGAGASDAAHATPAQVAAGTHAAFAVATVLALAALAMLRRGGRAAAMPGRARP